MNQPSNRNPTFEGTGTTIPVELSRICYAHISRFIVKNPMRCCFGFLVMIAHASDTAEDGNKHVDLFGTKPCLTTATGPETATSQLPSAPTRALSKWRKRLWNWLRDYWWFWTIFVAFWPICRAMASTPVQQALLQGQFTEIIISLLNVEWVLYLEIVKYWTY